MNGDFTCCRNVGNILSIFLKISLTIMKAIKPFIMEGGHKNESAGLKGLNETLK